MVGRTTRVADNLHIVAFLQSADGWCDHADVRGDTSHDEVSPTSLPAGVSKVFVIPCIDDALTFDARGERFRKGLLEFRHERSLRVNVGLLTGGQHCRHSRALGKTSQDENIALQKLQRSRARPTVGADLMVNENDGRIFEKESFHWRRIRCGRERRAPQTG